MKKLLAILALSFSLFGSMREKLSEADPGCYAVYESQKTTTIVHLHSKKDSTVILEEVSAPSSAIGKSWDYKSWIASGAPGNTSWIQYEFDLTDGKLCECYSFTEQEWLQSEGGILSTLFNLKLKPVSEKNRKRVGPTPPHHAIDIRPIWNPPKFVHGSQIKHAQFTALETHWPKDESEIAGKKIELYFDQTGFPLPYWIEIKGKIDANIHAIDSGNEMQSPKSHLPRRYPQVVGSYRKQNSLLHLQIQTPLYYKNFQLYNGPRRLPCNFVQQEDKLILEIDPTNIDRKEPLMLTPDSHPHIFVDLPPLPN